MIMDGDGDSDDVVGRSEYQIIEGGCSLYPDVHPLYPPDVYSESASLDGGLCEAPIKMVVDFEL